MGRHMRIDKSTAITTDSVKLPADGGAPLTLATVGSALEIRTSSTIDTIFAPVDRNIFENENKHSRKIHPAGSSKSLRPVSDPAG